MKDTLQPGLEDARDWQVDAERTIGFMGDELRVYATPWMVRDIEETARLLVGAHLDEGEESVGAHVSVDHLGATLLGMTVGVSVRVAEVDGRRVTLDAEVHDGVDLVGKARHVRFVIDRERQRERLERKRARIQP